MPPAPPETAAVRVLDTYLSACSVRGDVVHARRKGERKAVCGETNVGIVMEPWNVDSTYACRRCVRALQPAHPRRAQEE